MKHVNLWRCATVTTAILLIAGTASSPTAQAAQETSAWSNVSAQEFNVQVDPNFEPCSCCDDCCCGDSCCDCGSGVFGGKRLLGFIAPSAPCFDSFISPMTNPVFFEDPRTLTEARTIFMNHVVPNTAGGGDIQLLAVQLRAALTDRLSIIATKDGYVMSSNPLIDDGWADLAAGLKYNLISNVRDQRLLSAGFTYELPTGEHKARQGYGDGEFHLFLTGGMEIFDRGHWLTASGFRLAGDADDESDMWYWSNHFDYQVADRWYVLTEFNWFNWIGAGDGSSPFAVPGVEGADLFNFGSTGVAGNDIVTNAVGVKFKRSRNTELGVAIEYPLTKRRDVTDNRLTVDWILRY